MPYPAPRSLSYAAWLSQNRRQRELRLGLRAAGQVAKKLPKGRRSEMAFPFQEPVPVPDVDPGGVDEREAASATEGVGRAAVGPGWTCDRMGAPQGRLRRVRSPVRRLRRISSSLSGRSPRPGAGDPGRHNWALRAERSYTARGWHPRPQIAAPILARARNRQARIPESDYVANRLQLARPSSYDLRLRSIEVAWYASIQVGATTY
jgi:hypothetical protein